MHNLKADDYFAALVPPAAGLTLSLVNDALTTLSLAGGLAYLAWKWNRERKTPPKQ